MSNTDKCRVCLSDGAKYSIFENIESKDSVHSKLFQCLQEKIEDIEGYPRNICESCNNILNTTVNFITKFRTSCKLLQSNISVKKEICDSDDEVIKEEYDIELCKDEPETDDIEPFNISICMKPQTDNKKQETSITDIKAKLKGLKEINFKRKPTQKNNKKSSKIASSILEAEFDWNGESLKSNSIKEPREENPREPRKKTKLVLPKPPKQPQDGTSLCDICGQVFKDKEKLSKHRRTQHLNVPCECPKCQKVLKSNFYLNRHMKRVHGTKSLVCENCGKAYAFKTELSTHMRLVHLTKHLKPIKKFICDKCDKGFTNAKSLIIHERSAHTGHRPAECIVCGASFYHEDYLKEHLRLHTGETPFKCPICGRGYAQRGNMRSHISHNHRLADLSPEIVKNLKPTWFKYLKKP